MNIYNVGYYSEDPDVFLDAFDFWDEKSGIAFGDAINVSFRYYKTT
jgi:hypothetical protein